MPPPHRRQRLAAGGEILLPGLQGRHRECPAQRFDWQASANEAGYHPVSQVQALNGGALLIRRNATAGAFTLTVGVKKTSKLGLPFGDA